jgi:hypothetical protein
MPDENKYMAVLQAHGNGFYCVMNTYESEVWLKVWYVFAMSATTEWSHSSSVFVSTDSPDVQLFVGCITSEAKRLDLLGVADDTTQYTRTSCGHIGRHFGRTFHQCLAFHDFRQ